MVPFAPLAATTGFEWLALLMFAGMFLFLMTGYPVAFSFAGTAMVFGLIGLSLGAFNQNLINALPQRFFGTMSDFTLLAIPFFVFMGIILEKSGIAEELLEIMGILMGPIRGGLALAVIIVGTMLAATTGVVAASVIAMGLISLPIMLRYGYDKTGATGVIAASGTMAQLVPPSLVLIVLGDQLGVSVGDLFVGALIPGLLMASTFAAYTLVRAYANPNYAPALPPEARTLRGSALALRVVSALLPPLILIGLVLGTIFFGIATPTESGAVGALGALILAFFRRRLSFRVLREAVDSTLRNTALVVFILFGATFFSLVFEGLGGSRYVSDLLAQLPGGATTFLIVSMIVIFLLGIFLEFFEICFIVVPIFVPVLAALGIDPVWFGVLMAINLQTAFVSPPVGFSLFYLKSVAPPEITTGDIFRGGFQFMFLQLVVLIIVAIFPQTVTWLVQLSGG
ncbi:MAG: TRAP transporter large permease subunit [Chloroflexaceae bacterium]|jgi:tripartite ATP-independent transporter DctM subunit|nr:TRAP transporter large permease subunit [Chloroflexaceae bacterium]